MQCHVPARFCKDMETSVYAGQGKLCDHVVSTQYLLRYFYAATILLRSIFYATIITTITKMFSLLLSLTVPPESFVTAAVIYRALAKVHVIACWNEHLNSV